MSTGLFQETVNKMTGPKAPELFQIPDEGSGGFRPLADRLRPRSLEEFVGQEHLVGDGNVLRRMIERDRVVSMIFWGPPGSGKTTLARIIAGSTGSRFEHYSAVTCGVAQIKEAVKKARDALALNQKKTILFLDEIHRFNKAQQDALLPHVENGTITLLGATTENPSFEVNSALLSRVQVFVLKRLEEKHLALLLERALKALDTERDVSLEEKAKEILLNAADGDARSLLTALESAFLFVRDDNEGERALTITADQVAEAMQQRMIQYDRAGEQHYDVISAFIKSMRGSHADAALYWMARMLEAGEDPMFILRRMIIFAAEDIGNADPRALQVAVDAHRAFSIIGLPEGRIPMAQAVTYLATAPKSNASYLALKKALGAAGKAMSDPVPLHLRNAPTGLMKDLGYGENYKYPHDFTGGFAVQEYMPDSLKGEVFYKPKELGFEREIRKRIEWWKKTIREQSSDKKDKEEEN